MNIVSPIQHYIAARLHDKVINIKSISGGDISSAYCVVTSTAKYFLKVNSSIFALEMFQAEQEGLRAIEATNSISVPQVLLVDSIEGTAFILMDFVENKRPDSSDYRRLGTKLAELHQSFGTNFGFISDNFIGRLPQYNQQDDQWAEFYWSERILPQLKLALNAGLIQKDIFPDEKKAIILFRELFGNIQSVLLHGDLWGGNYLIATDGTPYLIDPAVYYGHSMVDIAMSHLFGGFGVGFYEAYHEIIPKPDNYDQQIELYQLYYLLVHLNMFGSSYYASVASIVRKYF